MNMNSFGLAKRALLGGIVLFSCCGCGHPVTDGPEPGNAPPPPADVTASAPAPDATSAQSSPGTAEQKPETTAATPADTTTDANKATDSAKADKEDKAVTPANAPKEEIKPEPKAKPMPTPSLVPNPKAVPVSFWKATPEKTLRQGNANDTKWAKFAVPLCRYTVELPGNYNVAKPQGFPHQDTRIIWAAGTDVKRNDTTKMMIVPWNLYKFKLADEIKKAEVSWFFSPELVQSATLTNQAQTKVGNYPAIRNTYSVIPLGEKGSEALELQLVATYVNVNNDCFAIIMSCPQSQASSAMESYEKVVKSLNVSASAPKTQAPPPDRAPKDKAPKGEYPGADKASKPNAPAKGNVLKPNMPLPSIVTDPVTKEAAPAKK